VIDYFINIDSLSLSFKKHIYNDSKSLKHDLNQIEDTFRHLNLLIQTIKDMQQKQETALNEIQSKLNEITIVKDHLTATNYFHPTFSLFNQEEETSLFGSNKLRQYSDMNSFKSQILTYLKQSIMLLKLCEFSRNDEWSLLYRGTRDGFGSYDFHSNCDGHSSTLTIFKAKQ